MKSYLLFISTVLVATVVLVQAQGTTYISNLGQASGGSVVVGSDSWRAESFLTGTNPGGYTLDSIQLLTTLASGNPSGFSISVYSSNAMNFRYPGNSIGPLNRPDPSAS